MTDARLINLRDIPYGQRWHLPPDTVRIDRASKWGNPFRIGVLDENYTMLSREAAISLYRDYATNALVVEPDWLEPLRGKVLACWCTPLACHGDVLLELRGRLYGE